MPWEPDAETTLAIRAASHLKVRFIQQSLISVDARAYQVGDTIPVRVELKDKYKNPVLDADLTKMQNWVFATVKVENAELSGSWKDNGNGVYTSDWKAMVPGDGLKATLRGRPGTTASSLYSITGMAVSANSTFTIKSQTYFIGDEISAEIVLKDAKNNPVTGQEAWIENNIMSGFPLKDTWSETAPGVYVAKYEADNKINDGRMILDMEGGGIASTPFQIVPGRETPVIANSTIEVDAGTPVGGLVTVEVHLKDAKGRPSSGHTAVLAASVNVPNATLTGAFDWQESDVEPGFYVAIYMGMQPGSGLRATLNLNDGSKQSNPFEIVTIVPEAGGIPVIANSTIEVDAGTPVGGLVTVEVHLKDAKGRPSSGHTAVLAASVNVPNATLTGAADWQESDVEPGFYVAIYMGVQPGSGLKATLNLNDGSKQSNSFEIYQ